MYVFNVENLDKSIIDKILKDGLAVDIRLDNTFMLSKEEEITVDGKIIHSDFNLEEYIKNMYDGGEYVDLHCMQIGINEAIDILVNGLYTNCKNGNVPYSERIYESENPNEEILIIIDECVLIELENRLKMLRRIKKQVQNEGIKWR